MSMNFEKIRLSFGSTLKDLRKTHDITQAELADRSHIDRSYLSAIETGSRNVALKNICQIASAFGMLPSELFKIVETNLDINKEQVISQQESFCGRVSGQKQ
jgi:transcriptional regulator with XRE-family HTH domain